MVMTTTYDDENVVDFKDWIVANITHLAVGYNTGTTVGQKSDVALDSEWSAGHAGYTTRYAISWFWDLPTRELLATVNVLAADGPVGTPDYFGEWGYVNTATVGTVTPTSTLYGRIGLPTGSRVKKFSTTAIKIDTIFKLASEES